MKQIVLLMGSKFKGFIADVPFIRVDYITKEMDYLYFVSHAHTDHLMGLNKEVKIHCTEPTGLYLQLKFDIPCNNIIILKQRQIINHKNKELCVELLDANHCNGSCMFLFKYNGVQVLYTGDCRLDGKYLSTNKTVFENMNLTHLYFDNTFSSARFYELPTIEESLHCLIRFIKKNPKTTHFYINFLFIGHEILFEMIYIHCRLKIHVDDSFLEMHRMIPCSLMDGYLADVMTTNAKETKFHFCPKSISCAKLFKPHNNCDLQCLHNNIIIKPCAMSFRSSITFDQGRYFQRLRQYQEDLVNFKYNPKKKCLVKHDKHNYRLLLSLHSSTIEIDTFLRIINCPTPNMYTIVAFNAFVHSEKYEYIEQDAYHFMTMESTCSPDVILSSYPDIDNKEHDELIQLYSNKS